jgi:hypothetical protein
LGLSSGFLDPLESTGLFLILAPMKLVEKLAGDINAERKFNKLWNKIYKETAYYVGMYYPNGPYNNDYWNMFGNKTTLKVPNEKWTFPEYSYRILAKAKSYNLI